MKIKDFFTDESKWCKGEYSRGEAHCIWGIGDKIYPIEVVVGDGGTFVKSSRRLAYAKIRQAIRDEFPGRGRVGRLAVGGPGAISIGAFNDHPDTTFEDVKRVLEIADV